MILNSSAFDDLASSLLEVVPMVLHALRSHMRMNRSVELSVPQFRALAYVRRHEAASLSDVAGHMGLTAPSASRLVDVLVARGFVERLMDPADRRKVTIKATDKGLDAWSTTREETLHWLAELLGGLSPAQAAELTRSLKTLRVVFDGPAARGEDPEEDGAGP